MNTKKLKKLKLDEEFVFATPCKFSTDSNDFGAIIKIEKRVCEISGEEDMICIIYPGTHYQKKHYTDETGSIVYQPAGNLFGGWIFGTVISVGKYIRISWLDWMGARHKTQILTSKCKRMEKCETVYKSEEMTLVDMTNAEPLYRIKAEK